MTKEIDIFEYLDFRAYLREYIGARKESNPAFSSRAVAQRLCCDPGFFNRVLNGTRNLSPELGLKVCDILKFGKRQRRYFELLVLYNQARSDTESSHYFEQLCSVRDARIRQVSSKQLPVYSRWYYVVLRELLNLVSCPADEDEASRELASWLEPKVPVSEVKKSVRMLQELGFVERKQDGTFQLSDKFITTGNDLPREVTNRILLEFIELARMAAFRLSRDERSISTLTFSASAEAAKQIKGKLEEYRREILSIVAADAASVDRVYTLNMQLFPVTKTYMRQPR